MSDVSNPTMSSSRLDSSQSACRNYFILHVLINHCRRVIQQLRACGVLETVRISAAGFPSRWSYTDFLHRYRLLLSPKKRDVTSTRAECESILKSVITERDKFQVGISKIFFRAGQVAYLENMRADKMKNSAIQIQACVKGWLQRKKYLKLRKVTLTLQSSIRRFISKQLYLKLRLTAAVMQSYIRGNKARQLFMILKRNAMAVRIQKAYRGYRARKGYNKYMRAVVLLQSLYRRRKARQEFRQLKIEARSVEGLKQINYGLERKVIELQQRMDSRAHEAALKQAEKVAQLELQLEQARIAASTAHTQASASSNNLGDQNRDLADQLHEAHAKIALLETTLSRSNKSAEDESKLAAEKVVIALIQ